MLHYSRVINGILLYIENEMAGKLAGSLKGWVLSVLAGMAAVRAESLFGTLANNPVAVAVGIIDGENVNVDEFMAGLRKKAQNDTATIPIPGLGPYTIGIADVNALERYIRG